MHYVQGSWDWSEENACKAKSAQCYYICASQHMDHKTEYGKESRSLIPEKDAEDIIDRERDESSSYGKVGHQEKKAKKCHWEKVAKRMRDRKEDRFGG